MTPMELTVNVGNRFVQAAVLLRMLDPVRGEATAHGLDQDIHEMTTPRERLLKRKFLDSFALICAVRKDGESVSAVCMEEGAPQGTIIRIASNAGVGEKTLREVRELVAVLNTIGDGGMLAATAMMKRHIAWNQRRSSSVQGKSNVEAEVLARIIRIDIAKIRHYLKDLRAVKSVFDEPVSTVKARIMASSNSGPALEEFLAWFRHFAAIKDLPLDPELGSLVECVKWAQKARAFYLDLLRAAFSTKTHSLPRWIYIIFKLGRYGIASKALVQLAFEFPALFNPVIVEPVVAPLRTPFTFPEGEIPLTCVLRRVVGPRTPEYLPRIARIWNTSNVENYFRETCSLNLIVHAEIQLVNFYDHNQQCRPSFRFIGVSKKSCYLCHMFLAAHPDSFCVSSCHQKLYLPWIPPPATDSSIYRQYKTITNELSKLMEAAAKHEIENRLGGQRRPIPADSTAGVSLSGLTDIVRRESPDLSQLQESLHVSSSILTERGESKIRKEEEAIQSSLSLHPIDVVELTPVDIDIEPITSGKGDEAIATEQLINNSNSTSVLAMVLHFMRADELNKQDIVRIRDIFDLSTNRPSWEKLLEILKADDGFGIAFKEGQQVLMINNQIRVSNERQFLACSQHLLKSNILNCEVLVCNI